MQDLMHDTHWPWEKAARWCHDCFYISIGLSLIALAGIICVAVRLESTPILLIGSLGVILGASGEIFSMYLLYALFSWLSQQHYQSNQIIFTNKLILDRLENMDLKRSSYQPFSREVMQPLDPDKM